MPLASQALHPAAVMARRRCARGGPTRLIGRRRCRSRSKQIAAAAASGRGRRGEDVIGATAAATEQRSPRARGAARAIGSVGGRANRDTGGGKQLSSGDGNAPDILGHQRRELRDRGELHPVGEPLLPGVGVPLDLATFDLGADVRVADGADLLAIDHQVPAAVSRGRGRRLGAAGLSAAHHDDVAALLAADLEDLAPNLFVGNRVLGPARVTNDLHQRLDSGGSGWTSRESDERVPWRALAGPAGPGMARRKAERKVTGKGPHYIEPVTGRKPSRARFPANSEH